jgi:hypothetical protein
MTDESKRTLTWKRLFLAILIVICESLNLADWYEVEGNGRQAYYTTLQPSMCL